jgi:nifR3 family TIM-barrel protein
MSHETSSHITIGRHVLPARAVLAPMSGVTDHGMRRAAMRFGAGMVVSEMVAADQLAAGSEEARLRAEGEGLPLHVVQLAGCEPGPMAEGARVAEASGADVIDINMGCPAKRVTNGWSGSALMRDLDHAQTLIDAVRAAVSVPVTLKMRLGWDHASLNAPELARRCESSGLSLVTVHGRTRQQFYKGEADWSAVLAVREATRLPLLVNGDIGSAQAAQAALAASGADGVMIGRAATGRPWMVGEIGRFLDKKQSVVPNYSDYAEAAEAHYISLIDSLGEPHGVRHARKHVAAYAEEAERLGAEIDQAEKVAMLTATLARPVMAFLGRIFRSIPGSQRAAA